MPVLEFPGTSQGGTTYHQNWTDASGAGSIRYPEALYNQVLSEQRLYNQIQMEREDTAYQRMVADMKAAGLNPWMGVSSGGLASTPATPPKKSALDSLLQILNYNENKAHKDNSDMLSAVNTGVRMALPFLALLGI